MRTIATIHGVGGFGPGAGDRQESDFSPELLAFGGDLLQRFGGGSEQTAVNLSMILKRDRTGRRRKRKKDRIPP